MKTIRSIPLAIVMMSCFVATTTANELKFSVPDIGNNLDKMVEEKMDSLSDKIHSEKKYSNILRQMEYEFNHLLHVNKMKNKKAKDKLNVIL